MAALLVSVRSADEAPAALAGGASVIDVKEPDRGPLGRADVAVWRAIRRVVPDGIPLSLAMGELPDWDMSGRPDPESFKGFSYRKLGLAGAGPDWRERWDRLRRDLGSGPAWVAVAYADWQIAEAPGPGAVLDAALAVDDCAGVLVDTFAKGHPSPIDASWADWVDGARRGGRFVAVAGGLDESAIRRLASLLRPDLFAVRGAACVRGDRHGAIDPRRVAALAHMIARLQRSSR